MAKRLIARLATIIFAVSALLLPFNTARAEIITTLGLSLSSSKPHASATHLFSWNVPSGHSTKEFWLQYGTTSGGSNMPANVNLSLATLGSTTLESSWTLDTSSAASGLLKITNPDLKSLSTNTPIEIAINSVLNPKIGDCNGNIYAQSDQCYVQIIETDESGNPYSTGNLAYTIAAGSLSVSDTLDSIRPLEVTSHIISFSLASTTDLRQIDIRFAKSESDVDIPSNLDLTNATIGSITGLYSSNWSLDKTSASSGLLKLIGTEQENVAASTQITIRLNSITNPEVGDCSLLKQLMDICGLQVSTYSDFGNSMHDRGSATYQIEDEPTLAFTIEGVASGQTINGVTTNIPSDFNKIDFGRLEVDTPKFSSHKLTVATTAPNGYTVKVKLNGYIQGLNPANKIDPFAALNASWSTPQPWSHPTGTTKNSDSGWIGANTSDGRITGWAGGSGKFGPISSTNHLVMTSDKKEYGITKFVTYGIEINGYQPPDSYAGTLVYDITPVY